MSRKLLSVKYLFLIFILISFLPLSTTRAAGIIVNSNGDSIDANGGLCAGMVIGDLPGPDGVTTLREAICAANGSAGADTITFAEDYTITLAGSQYPAIISEITIQGNGQAQTIIQASTCNPITLPGDCTPANYRVFQINNGILALEDLTVQHGNPSQDGGGILISVGTFSMESCTIQNNAAGDDGGGIFKEAGTISFISNSLFSGNQAYEYGGALTNYRGPINSISSTNFRYNSATTIHAGCIFNASIIGTIEDSTFTGNTAGFHGGCIYNTPLSSITTINNSSFTNNQTVDHGGAIRNRGTISLIKDSTFSGNSGDDGGAIHTYSNSLISAIDHTLFDSNSATLGGAILNNRGNLLTITGSTFTGNTAGNGGAIYNIDAHIPNIIQSTFTYNRADVDYGGGIFNAGVIGYIGQSAFTHNTADLLGGGIYNTQFLDIVSNSTFSGNTAGGAGGGIYNSGDIDTINYSTFADNVVVTPPGDGSGIQNDGVLVDFSYSIVGNNVGSNCDGSSPSGSIGAISDSSGCWGAATTLTSAHLGPLANNGGPTQTHALLFTTPANPAINGGMASCAGAPVFDQDQRGVTRSLYGNCDIGAFEYTGTDTPLMVTATDPNDGSEIHDLAQITVSFNKAVVSDGSADAANNTSNYLLVDRGNNGIFDTLSCAEGLQADDTQIPLTGAVYNGGSYTATLSFTPSPLPIGIYRLFVCGTTSIYDTIGLELNNGAYDTEIDFSITEAPSDLPDTGFSPGMITPLPAQPEGKSYSAHQGLWLEIPKLGLGMEIVGVPLVDGEWDVSWLGSNAGYLEGTAFPTWNGNTVITAHIWDAWNQPGPFLNLKNLQYGDRFYIHAFGQIYLYEVRDNYLVKPDNLNVLGHSDFDLVTLLTCERWSVWAGQYRYRRAVQAVLVDIQ